MTSRANSGYLNTGLPDPTPEEVAKGMADSVKYVAQTFLGDPQYKVIHQTLSNKWDRLHSLSAAIQLMKHYKVELTREEEEALSGMDEAQQINELVSKMPRQSNDQFQEFFIKLQLLVSTAMRVRRSLEEGKPDEVAQALEDAEATGISSYILRVAIVQAGSEVANLRQQFEDWIRAADAKLGGLIRGQQDALAAQRKLASAKAELMKHNQAQNEKAAKAMMAFASGNDKAIVSMSFNGWFNAMKTIKLESAIRLEYKDRLEACEANLEKWKVENMKNTKSVLVKKFQEDQARNIAFVFSFWRRDVESTKFEQDNAQKIVEMAKRLETTKKEQLDNSRKVMQRFAAAGDEVCLTLALQGWIAVRKEAVKDKEAFEAKQATETRLRQFTKNKSENAKGLLQSMAGATDTGLVHQTLVAWVQATQDAKREAEIEQIMNAQSAKFSMFSEKNKVSAGSAMSRARFHMEQMVLLRCLSAWRLDHKMERSMRHHHARIDAKRQQLMGVQQMFRNFATQLEGGLKDGSNSNRLADSPFDKPQLGRRLNKTEGATSLPDIHQKPSSGRSGQRATKPGTPTKLGRSDYMEGSGSQVPSPKPAWG